MRLSRFTIRVPAALLGPLFVLALGITGCPQPQPVANPQQPVAKTPGTKTLSCDTTVKVTPGAAHGVDKDAIFVCADPNFNQVSWVAPKGVTFDVHFVSGCPFTSCAADITDNTPQTVGPQPAVVTVYKYTIKVTTGGHSTIYGDPHVVGGGY